MNIKDKQRDQAWTHFAISGLLPEGLKAGMASSTDKLHCEDLPTAQEKIMKAALSGTPSRVLITQTQFLVSSSLLMQQFFLSCHAYQWEFWYELYIQAGEQKKKYSCHLILLKKPPKDKRPAKSLPWKARIFANSCLIYILFCFTKTQVFTYLRHTEHILWTVEESCCNVKRVPQNASQTPSSSLHWSVKSAACLESCLKEP